MQPIAKRTPLPEHLERVEIMVDIDDADKICGCCGEKRQPMGEAVTERLIVIPAKVQLKKLFVPNTFVTAKNARTKVFLSHP